MNNQKLRAIRQTENSEIEVFKGILRTEGRHCYLVPLVGRWILLFLNVPTGAGWFEGFAAATGYFQRIMKKNSGDYIEIDGVKFRFEKETVIQFLPN
jgi:hypothetical protein